MASGEHKNDPALHRGWQPASGYRVTIEERALAETLGDPYREYMRRIRHLIPYIW